MGEQLGLQGHRRNGQLMTGPHEGKIVELTEEHFPWLGEEKFEKCRQVGGHRYPSSWLADRMAHVEDGVPKKVEWSQVLEIHERQGDPEKLSGDVLKDLDVGEDAEAQTPYHG